MERASNLVEQLQASVKHHGDRPVLGTRSSGTWSWLSYLEFGELVDRARAGLAWLGVGPGDCVAIVGDNSVEWAAAAYATYGLGASFVPMYPAQKPREWLFILRDCGAKVVLAAGEAVYKTLEAARAECPMVGHVIGVGGAGRGAATWRALLAAGAARPVAAASPPRDAIASLMYTSGTTGLPKGVLLSHANMMSNIAASNAVFPLAAQDRTLSVLPWAHIYGQMCDLHMVISYGGSTAINDELARVFANLAEIRPTLLVAVPRIYNRIYDLVRAATDDLAAVVPRVRACLGNNLRRAFSGSAPLRPQVIELFDAAGIELYEGYGLTETSPTVTTNWPGSRKLGSVGRAVPGVRIEIDRTRGSGGDDGEIIVYGPNVMVGYHDRPEEQRNAITSDGGLRTGDLGRLDDEGFLVLTGRIKEQYKLENGKYVMPAPLEEMIKASPFVASVMLYGDGRPHNVALIVPDAAAIRAWAAGHDLALGDELTSDRRIRELIRSELDRRCAAFKSFERPREFALLADDFTIDNGLLTPTLKIKRREVVGRYGELLDKLYRDAA